MANAYSIYCAVLRSIFDLLIAPLRIYFAHLLCHITNDLHFYVLIALLYDCSTLLRSDVWNRLLAERTATSIHWPVGLHCVKKGKFVTVLSYLSITPGRHMWEWMYRPVFS
jgi:hypothetical protein